MASYVHKINGKYIAASKAVPGSSLDTDLSVIHNELSTKKGRQDPVASPDADGSDTAFIDTVSQDANGEITVTKKNVQQASTSSAGIVRLSSEIDSTSETMAATPKAVHDAIIEAEQATVAGLTAENDVPDGHYITSVDETDGIVSITVTEMDSVPTQDSSRPVKSGGVFASIGAAIAEVGGWLGNLTVSEVNAITTHKKGDSATMLDAGIVMPGNVSVNVGDDIMWMDGLQVWQPKISDELHHDNTLVGTGSTNEPIGVNPQEVVTSDSLTDFVEQETESSDIINIVTSVTASNGKLKVKNKSDIGLYFIGSAHRMGFGTYWEG